MRPQLVLIPGLLNDAELWADQILALSDAAEIVVADITQGETLEALAEGVLAQAGPRFALAGFSLGGIVAQEVLRQAPDRVTHLALLDTTMRPDGPDRAAERKRLIAMASRADRFHGFGEALLAKYLAAENLANPMMGARIREMTARLGAEVFIRQSLIDRRDGEQVLRQTGCPALVLCGAQDQITPPALHREMAGALPDARLVILPEAGHMTPIEQPEAVSSELRRLLERSPA